MKTADSTTEALIRQRKRFEALGNALKKASSMSSWFKVMFATTLIFGLPTIILLSNPLKDSTTFGVQALVYGSRVLLIAILFYLLSRITPELYTAKNDLNMKIEEIGFQEADTNTKKETNLVIRNMLFSILKILVFISSGFGFFLLNSRVNYGYIIGQQVIYVAVIVIIIVTVNFWKTSKPDYSPRLGGRIIILSFIPATYFWGLEIIIDFFSVISDPNIRYNYTQTSFGFAYPFLFLFLIIAVLFTTKKTIREKTTLQEAREAEFKRVSSFIEEKNFYRRFKYRFDMFWNNITQTLVPKLKQRDIDKKPNLILINSIWLSLFISIPIVGFIIPWNIFPQDGILFISCLMIYYQFSLLKYERNEVEVLSEPDKNEELTPLKIRTIDLPKSALRLVLLPTIIFVVIQYVLSGVISGGILTTDNRMLILMLTWVSVLIVIPTSIQLMLLIAKDLEVKREFKNFKMLFKMLIYLLGFEVILYICTAASLFIALHFDFQFIDTTALILQAVIVGIMVILPIIFMLIAMKTDDQGYRILRICTWVLLSLVSLVLIEEFIHLILVGYFLIPWPW